MAMRQNAINNSLLVLLIALIVSACSSTYRQQLVAADERIGIVKAGSETTWKTLAEQYLGDPASASVLRRYNPGLPIVPGSHVLVPLQNLNPSAVYSDGYQLVPILCYHRFTDAAQSDNRLVISARNFEQQMAYLQQQGYQVISLRELSLFLNGDRPLPDRSVAITVDDGYSSFLQVAYPILQKYGFPTTVFVYPEFVGGGLGLNWEQIRALDEDSLVDIQSHSKTHSSLSPFPEGEDPDAYLERIHTEVVETDRIFQRKLGRRASRFAYPYGDSSDELIALLQGQQYDMALTVSKGSNATFAFPYLVRRAMIFGDTTLSRFRSHLDVFHKTDLK